MKSNNTIWVILLIFFVFLGSMELMMWKKYNDKLNERNANITTEDSQKNITHVNGNPNVLYMDPDADEFLPNEAAEFEVVETDETDMHKYIFVGDSRYVAMSEYAQSFDVFFCKNGVGLYFLKNKMDSIIEAADSNTRIVIGLGVNDAEIGNDGYTETILDLCSRTDAEVYYMLINPVKDNACAASGYTVSNSDIDRFNANMIEELNGSEVKIIDTNTYLLSSGYTTSDGLHYDDETTKKIYDYIKLCIRNQ